MAEEDIVINLEGGDDNGPKDVASAAEKLSKSLDKNTKESELARKSAKTSERLRDEWGRFVSSKDKSGSGSGGSGGSSSPGWGGTGGTLPRKKKPGGKDFQFRVEGLMNLLKGGSNIRLRGIQSFSTQQLATGLKKAMAYGRASNMAVSAGRSTAMGTRMAVAGFRATTALMNVGRAAAAAASTMNPIGIAIAAAIVAIGLFTTAMFTVHKKLSQLADAVTKDIAGVTPRVSRAQALAKLSDTMNRIKVGRQVGAAASSNIQQQQVLTNEFREFKASLFQLLRPFLAFVTTYLTGLMKLLNGIMDILVWWQGVVKWAITGLLEWWARVDPVFGMAYRAFKRWLRDREKQDQEEAKKLTKEMIEKLRKTANRAAGK